MSESFGTWRLESVIAVGGLGEIWRARRGGEVVALKRLHTHLLRNDEVRAQFSSEQRLTTDLPRHPNLVYAIETGAIAGRPYIALALAPGEDVRRLLAAPTPNERTERSPGRHAGGAVGPEQRSEGRSEGNERTERSPGRHAGGAVGPEQRSEGRSEGNEPAGLSAP